MPSKNYAYAVKKTLYASEQDTPRVQELRHDYRRWLDKIDVRNLVFVDEAGLNLSMSRLFAKAQAGERAIGSIPANKFCQGQLFRLSWASEQAGSAPWS